MARSTLFLLLGDLGVDQVHECMTWIRARHTAATVVTPKMLSTLADLMEKQKNAFVLSCPCGDEIPFSEIDNVRSRGHRLVVVAFCLDDQRGEKGAMDGARLPLVTPYFERDVPALARRADHAMVVSCERNRACLRPPCLHLERGRVIGLGSNIPPLVSTAFENDIAEFLWTRPGAAEHSLEEARRFVRTYHPSAILKTAHSGTYVGSIIGNTSLNVVQRVDYASNLVIRGEVIYVAHFKLNLPRRIRAAEYLSITHHRGMHATQVTVNDCRQLGPPELNDPLVTLSLPANYARAIRAFVAEMSRAVAIPGTPTRLSPRLVGTLVSGADRCMTEKTDIDQQRKGVAKWVARELGCQMIKGGVNPFNNGILRREFDAMNPRLSASQSFSSAGEFRALSAKMSGPAQVAHEI